MFVFGLIVGLVIGAIGAVLIYHNNQKKFNEYIDKTEADLEAIQNEAEEKIKALEQKIENILAPKSQPEQNHN